MGDVILETWMLVEMLQLVVVSAFGTKLWLRQKLNMDLAFPDLKPGQGFACVLIMLVIMMRVVRVALVILSGQV